MKKICILILKLQHLFFIYFRSHSTPLACFFLKMAEKFNWFRLGYELVKAKFEWNVLLQNSHVPFLQNIEGDGEYFYSPLFPTPEILNSSYNLEVHQGAEQIVNLRGASQFCWRRRKIRRTSSSENVDP